MTEQGRTDIPRVPVFMLPEGLPHKYVLADGHYRHETATKLGFFLPCNIYEKGDKLGKDKDGLAPCWMHDHKISEFYDNIIRSYLKHQKIK